MGILIRSQHIIRKGQLRLGYVHDTKCHWETDVVCLRGLPALSGRIIIGANGAIRSSTFDYDVWKPDLGSVGNVLTWTEPWIC